MSEPSKAMIIGCGIFFTAGIMSICILSSVFYFHQPDSYVLCKKNVNPDQPFAMDTFFLIAFIIFMILNGSNLLANEHLPICKFMIKPQNRQYYKGLWGAFWMTSLGLVFTVMSIIGFVLRSKSTQSCKDSSTGKGLLAFSVLAIIYGPLMICLGPLQIMDARKKRDQGLTESLNTNSDYKPVNDDDDKL